MKVSLLGEYLQHGLRAYTWNISTSALNAEQLTVKVDRWLSSILHFAMLLPHVLWRTNKKSLNPIPVAPLTWVPWVPRNPSIFELLVQKPINFEKKGPKFTLFLFYSILHVY